MKNPLLSFLGVVLLTLLTLTVISNYSLAQTNCCPPPRRPSQVPRYPQDSPVTVYINTTGFTETEMQAIEAGITDWNGEANSSGVEFTPVRTTNPPALPHGHAVTVSFNSQVSPAAIAETETRSFSNSSGLVVHNVMTFYGNIRQGIASALPGLIRSVARHEGGHALGLGNADNCTAGSTIMRLAVNGETFITQCDNDVISSQSAYPGPTLFLVTVL